MGSLGASPRIDVAAWTHRGCVRRRNEDAYLIRPSEGVVAVADGLGGAPAGDVASASALAAMAEGLSRDSEDLTRAFQQAYVCLREAMERDPSLKGMGTTLTVLVFEERGLHFRLAHVGDSRAYVLSSEGARQITSDHTWVQEEVRAGRLSRERARTHPQRHLLTQVVAGHAPPNPEVSAGTLPPEGWLLLCTDGLTECLSDDEITSLVQEGHEKGLEWVGRSLLERAWERGAPDNVTFILMRPDPGSL